jgi:cell division protein FtsQ
MSPTGSEMPKGNRADQMRQRRSQTSKTRVEGMAHRATYENVAPARPVIVRNTTFGTPIRQRVATSNPRKQFYVPLATPGTELRLPALPTLRPGPRILSGLIVIIAAIGIFSMLFSSVFTIDNLAVKGTKRLTQANIGAALNIQNLSVVELDTQTLRTELLTAYPILENASVNVSLPNTVSVTVSERQPILDWKIGDNHLWADKKGVLFQPAGENPNLLTILSQEQPPLYVSPEEQKALQDAAQTASTNPSAPAVLNNITSSALNLSHPKTETDRIDPVLLQTAQKLAAHLPAGTVLAYSKASGLGWKDPGGWEVYIGTELGDFDQKFALYQSISEQLAGQGITPTLISVEFVNAPYYRVEK